MNDKLLLLGEICPADIFQKSFLNCKTVFFKKKKKNYRIEVRNAVVTNENKMRQKYFGSRPDCNFILKNLR